MSPSLPHSRALVSGLRAFAALGVAVVFWEALARLTASPYVVTVAQIYEAFRRDWMFTAVTEALAPSLFRLAVGFALGCFAGIVLGVAIGYSRPLYRVLEPTLEISRALPTIALLPVFIVFLGLGDSMRIAIICLGVFFPVLVNTAAGSVSTSPARYDVARMFQLDRKATLLRVVLPSAVPMAAVGVRVAIPIGFIMMIISELAGGTDGLGAYLRLNQERFDIAAMMVALLILGALGLSANWLYSLFERKFLFWCRFV